MDAFPALLAAVAAAAALALGWWLARRGVKTSPSQELDAVASRLADAQAALAGRMSQMAESQQAAQHLLQSQLAERLQAQERAVTKLLDERLTDVTRRVGESLTQTTDKTAQSLSQLQERLAVIDAAQKNLTDLSAEVVSLQDLLSNKQARGAIGQTQMEDLVRNMLPPRAYEFQFTLSNGKRADCVIHLPNPPGLIAVDSKYPHEAFVALMNARDDRERQSAEQAFRGDVLKHIRDIAEKYIVPGETADSAIMFVPAESVFATLHEHFPALVEEGFRRRVYIVSPTTLMATLNTVRAILKDARMREQAHIIQREIAKLMDDMKRLDERVQKLGSHFEQSREDVRQILTSSEKIRQRGERIETIPLEPTQIEPAPPRLEQLPAQP